MSTPIFFLLTGLLSRDVGGKKLFFPRNVHSLVLCTSRCHLYYDESLLILWPKMPCNFIEMKKNLHTLTMDLDGCRNFWAE